jgi:tetratricopeptide (TPR) repeat protein
MTFSPRLDMHRVRLLALTAALACSSLAFADEYGDVSQLIRTGHAAEAVAKADQYLAARPRDPQLRFLKGVAQTDAGRAADAIATFTALNQEYPELPEPYNNLAVIYASQSQFDKARAALETAVRANPDYAVAYENLGDVYAKLAAQSYAKAQQLERNNTGVGAKLTLIRQLFAAPDKVRATPAAPAASAAAR